MEISQKQTLFQSLVERLTDTATVQKVYGEPIVHEQKTIIPVAKVTVGLGGGFGEGNLANSLNSPKGEGGGLGGGLMVKPLGVIEITTDDTRFVPIRMGRYIAAGVAIGFVLGRIFRR